MRGAAFVLLLASIPAQASAPIDDAALLRSFEVKCAELREAGRLVPLAALHAQPPPAQVGLALAPRRDRRLEPEELSTLLRQSAVIVGVYYHCTDCDGWHLDAASGVALTADGAVATCWHVLERDELRRDARVVVADLEGRVWPVRRVLAADPRADLCILDTEAKGKVPMPLRTDARAGERVYCLSNPDHRFGFFAEGLLARSFVDREPPAEEDRDRPLPPGRPAFEVTLDFAAGSSGAAVCDRAGNAIGLAQATQTIVTGAEDEAPDVQMVVKIVAPAAALSGLVRAPK